jgi:hypothetical protein
MRLEKIQNISTQSLNGRNGSKQTTATIVIVVCGGGVIGESISTDWETRTNLGE